MELHQIKECLCDKTSEQTCAQIKRFLTEWEEIIALNKSRKRLN